MDIESHLKMVRTYNTNKNTRIFLIGNKVDLDKNREVTKEEGEQFALEHNIDLFREIFQKTNHNARNILIEAAKLLYDAHFGKSFKSNKLNKYLNF